MSNAALEQLVDEVRDLPLTVSDVLAQVITECDNADASVSSLARIMAGDQALAAMVLKLANSAYYGYARRIESLPDAVVLLGFASVKNLAITASITRLLATDQDDLTEIRSGIFDHSLCTAVCARILGRTKRVSGEKAFVAGLLHDLGLIVLVCYRKPLFGALMQASETSNLPFHEVELDVCGFEHAELGSLIAA
jgi:HD-like signal output (HDOD) protein